MQMFNDLPLSLKAAIGGALILILLLVLVRQRKEQAGSGGASREKKAKTPKAEKTPKTAKASKADKPAKAKRTKDKPAKEKAPKEKTPREGRRFGRRRGDAPAEPAPVPTPVAEAAPTSVPPVPAPAPQPGWPTAGEMSTDPLPEAPDATPDGAVLPSAAPVADPAWADVLQPADPAWADPGEGVYETPPADTWPGTGEAGHEPSTYEPPIDPEWAAASDELAADADQGADDAPAEPAWGTDDTQTWAAPVQDAYGVPVEDPTWTDAAETVDTAWTTDAGVAPADEQVWTDPGHPTYDTAAADATWTEPALTADAGDQGYGQPVEASWAAPAEESAWTADADPAGYDTGEAAAFDPATGWTADEWSDQAPATGATGDDWSSEGDWESSEGDWESSEDLLPEAPQTDAGWDGGWDTTDAVAPAVSDEALTSDGVAEWATPADDGVPGVTAEFAALEATDDSVPESTPATADDLDWSALGTIDADIPATPWTEDALPVEGAADGQAPDWATDDAVGEPVGDAVWEPIDEPMPEDGVLDRRSDDDTVIESPTSWDADPVWEGASSAVNGSNGHGALASDGTPGFPGADSENGAPPIVNGATVVGSVEDIASAVRPLAGDDAAVVIDLAKILGNGAPVELVIEQSHEGIRLRVGRSAGADVAAGSADPATTIEATVSPVDEPAGQPSAGEDTPFPVSAGEDGTSDQGIPAIAGVEDHADVPAAVAAPSAPAGDSQTGSADQDPSRILADIRARLAALDARRGSDGSES